jgi:pimeloyl-ACP methyl ester carboxylesterase
MKQFFCRLTAIALLTLSADAARANSDQPAVPTLAYVVNEPAKNCSIKNQPRDASITEGKKFTVEIQGNGPDVILIPGMATPRTVWDDTVTALAGCYRLHSVQVRGFGDDAGVNASGSVLDPMVSELADYIENEIIKKGRPAPALIGHSMGGLAALMTSVRKPQLASKLMIVDALPSFAVLIPGLAGADAATIQTVASGMRGQIISTYGKPSDPAAVNMSVQGMALKSENLAKMRLWSANADPRVVGQLVYDDLITDMRPQLPKIAAPVTALAAWHSGMPYNEQQVASFFTRQFTGILQLEVVTVTDSAHFIMLDQPDKFLGAVTTFLLNKSNPC